MPKLKITDLFELVPNADKLWEHSIKNPDRICMVEGCGCISHDITPSKAKLEGRTLRRPYCYNHYYALLAYRRGDDPSMGKNSFHPYLRYRKMFCENVDGRLGFVCTTTIILPKKQLDTDHINGDPTDNRPENMQTLCKCCHAYKTHINGDNLTPGRKTLKRAKVELSENDLAVFIKTAKFNRKLNRYTGNDGVVSEMRKI